MALLSKENILTTSSLDGLISVQVVLVRRHISQSVSIQVDSNLVFVTDSWILQGS